LLEGLTDIKGSLPHGGSLHNKKGELQCTVVQIITSNYNESVFID